jgi:hypothetical protein
LKSVHGRASITCGNDLAASSCGRVSLRRNVQR